MENSKVICRRCLIAKGLFVKKLKKCIVPTTTLISVFGMHLGKCLTLSFVFSDILINSILNENFTFDQLVIQGSPNVKT